MPRGFSVAPLLVASWTNFELFWLLQKASGECSTLEYSRGNGRHQGRHHTGEEAATQLRMAPLARRVEA